MAATTILTPDQRLRGGTLVSEENKKERKQGWDRKEQKSRICLGKQIGRWMAVKVSIGLSKNEDVAKMLLDSWCLINSFFVDDLENLPDKDCSPDMQATISACSPHLNSHRNTCTKTTSAMMKETSLSQNIVNDSGQTSDADNADLAVSGINDSSMKHVEKGQQSPGVSDRAMLSEVKTCDEATQGVGVGELTPSMGDVSDIKEIKCEPDMYIERKRFTDSVTSPSTDDGESTKSEDNSTDSEVDDMWSVNGSNDNEQVKCDVGQSTIENRDIVLDLSCSEEDVDDDNLSSHPVRYVHRRNSPVQQIHPTPLKQRKARKASNQKSKMKTAVSTRKRAASSPEGGYRQSKRLQKKGRRSYVDDIQEADESHSVDTSLEGVQVTESHYNLHKGDFSSVHPKKRHTARYSEAEMNDHIIRPQTQCISTQTDNKRGERSKSKVKDKTEISRVPKEQYHSSDAGKEQDIDTSSGKVHLDSDYLKEPEPDESDYDPLLDEDMEAVNQADSDDNLTLDEEEPVTRKKRKYTKRKKGKKEMIDGESEGVEKGDDDGEDDKEKAQRVVKKSRAKRKTRNKGEKLNCLPGSRRSDKYFPDINVQLEEHEDKYEVITWTSHCKKDRGVDVEQKSFHGYGCKMCSGVFKTTDRSVMEVHLKEHMQGKLTCGECGLVFSYYTQLRKHRLKLHVEAKYTCEECGEQFHYIKVLHTHLSKVHNKKVYQCKKCQMNFQSNVDRKAHSLEVHPECFDKCTVCGETVNMTLCKNAMERHMRSYWCQRTASSICEICGKEVQRLSIKTHIRRVHHKTKTLRCDICDFSTHLGSTYKLHMMTHTGEHPVKCSLCDFSCIRSYQLTSHMRTHTGDKPYKCDKCNYASAWNVQLKDHKKAHFSDDQINCDTCNITFKDRRGLNMHISKEHANTSVADSYVVKKTPTDTNHYPTSGNQVDANSYTARGHQSAINAYSGQGNPSTSDDYIVRGNLGVQNSYNARGNHSVTEAYVARGGNLY
ncbi:uncharacterized protein LOC110459662 [Mizuhopecten yessoensis]|uniref:Zinc finger protein 26 n=1 Tax=Mizuhopecten yessoensis TaxID=6573 RepID=A0A210Q433_MIZYE|nr:uncharacterized protein LOC110459662 [Mizuhopecten yessoensis]OWF43500.1 Zinc finger protein 26 [Mizuhopecten yessoensis]